MISDVSNLEVMQNDAASEANGALQISVDCLPSLLELTQEKSLEEIILMTGFMVAFQVSLESRRIALCLDDIRETLEANSNNDENNARRVIEHLEVVVESIDFPSKKIPEFWMTSDEAAKDKAIEIGLKIPAEWSMADLRYKLHKAIYGGENG